MNEASATYSLRRNVNIDSAIDESSFHEPVLVAISTDGSEAEVVKTFAMAREVFGHIFPIFLDRSRQCRAVKAVEGLVPESEHLSALRDTQYVLIVRAKAVFWFSGAAAKRAASRRLLLEHACDLAKAEQAPFYILNSRAKKRRAAILAAGLAIMVAAGALLGPVVTSWTGELTRHQTVSTSHPSIYGGRAPDQQKSVSGPDFVADDAGADGAADLLPTAAIPSRHGPPSSASDPKMDGSKDWTSVSKFSAQMDRVARAWPDDFHDRLLFSYWYFGDVTTAPRFVSAWPSVPQSSPAPTIAGRPSSVSDLGITKQTPVPDNKTN